MGGGGGVEEAREETDWGKDTQTARFQQRGQNDSLQGHLWCKTSSSFRRWCQHCSCMDYKLSCTVLHILKLKLHIKN